MLLQLLGSPAEFIGLLVALLFAISWHEAAHGFVALLLGDDTPRVAGRVTLNPLAHLDPIGSLLLILFGFGWGKPVPINPANLRGGAIDEVKVALAGPGSNLLLATVFGLSLRYFGALLAPAVLQFLSVFIYINIVLAVFNILPIPPLDGSKLLRLVVPFETYLALERLAMPMLLGLVALSYFGLPLFQSFVSGPASFLFHLITGLSAGF